MGTHACTLLLPQHNPQLTSVDSAHTNTHTHAHAHKQTYIHHSPGNKSSATRGLNSSAAVLCAIRCTQRHTAHVTSPVCVRACVYVCLRESVCVLMCTVCRALHTTAHSTRHFTCACERVCVQRVRACMSAVGHTHDQMLGTHTQHN